MFSSLGLPGSVEPPRRRRQTAHRAADRWASAATASSSWPLRSRAERAAIWLRMLMERTEEIQCSREIALVVEFAQAARGFWATRHDWSAASSGVPIRRVSQASEAVPSQSKQHWIFGSCGEQSRIKARAPAGSPRARVSFRFNGRAPNARPIFLRLGSPKRAWAAALGRRNWWWCPGLLVGGSPRTGSQSSPTDR